MISPFKNPDLMVIGDSLAQGCKSLTVSGDYCGRSYSAVLAGLCGWNMAVPDMKRPILFKLEDVARQPIFAGIPDILGGIGANYDLWRHGFSAGETNSISAAPFFDNLAVAGSTLADLSGRGAGTPALADQVISEVPDLNLLVQADRDQIGNLHVAVNTRFVLNPANDPQYQGKSQLDWVLDRQPKRLIVHAGHNDGLYAIGSEGDDTEWQSNWGPGGTSLNLYLKALDRLCAGAPQTRILVLGLPKVGAVANLMPAGMDRLPANPAYFAQYTTVFPAANKVPGDFVATADAAIVAVNAQLSAKVAALRAGGASIDFFDVFGLFNQYDAKNLSTSATPLVVDGTAIRNTYLAGQTVWDDGPDGEIPHFEVKFASGGLQSIDGMHPTAVGYALLAAALVGPLTGTPASDLSRAQILSSALEAETLITDFPAGLPLLVGIANRFAANTSANPLEDKLGTAITGIHQALA